MRNVLRARASILNQQQARRKASRRITAAFFVSIMAFSIFSTPTLGIMQYVSAQSSKEDRSTRLKLPKALKEADSTVTTVPQLADKKLAKTKLKDEGIAQSGTGQLPPVASREKSERRELTEQREANKEVIKNEDGSITEKHYFAPKYFKKNNQWKNVDTSLKEDINAADATNPVTRFWGKVRSGFTTPKTFIMRENEWQARFASSNDKVGMVRVRYGNQNVSFSPENANKVAPVIQTTSEGQQVVIYRELWPGVDLEYTVHSTELKENIVLKDKNAKTNFTFKVGGASLRPDANNPGGYTIDGALDNKFALTPLNFILNNQGYVTKDVLNQSFNDGKLNISVDQK